MHTARGGGRDKSYFPLSGAGFDLSRLEMTGAHTLLNINLVILRLL